MFVNAAVDDGSEVAQMMQYFKNPDPDDMSQGPLSKRVHFLKCEKGGYEEMCEVAEKINEQGIEQGIEQGEMEKAKATAVKLYHKGWKEAEIADLLNYGIEIVKGWLGLSLA